MPDDPLDDMKAQDRERLRALRHRMKEESARIGRERGWPSRRWLDEGGPRPSCYLCGEVILPTATPVEVERGSLMLWAHEQCLRAKERSE